MAKTQSERQKSFRNRLNEKGGRVVTFCASSKSVEFIDSQKSIGVNKSEAINKAIEHSAAISNKYKSNKQIDNRTKE